MHKRFNSKNFEILNVSFDEDKEKWNKYISKENYSWLNALESEGMAKSVVAQKLELTSLSANFLLDKEGKILARNVSEKDLERILEKLLP